MISYRKKKVVNVDFIMGQTGAIAMIILSWFYLDYPLNLFFLCITPFLLTFALSRYLREVTIDPEEQSLELKTVIGRSLKFRIEKIDSVELAKSFGFGLSRSKNIIIRRKNSRPLLFEVYSESEKEFASRFIEEFENIKSTRNH